MKAGIIPSNILSSFRRGMVISAMPLALDSQRRVDERHQRALVRYTIDAGAGGLAVGVHTTQFQIRDRDIALFEPVLTLVSETIDAWSRHRGRSLLKIAGVCGRTAQACQEAGFARAAGYHACLLSMSALANDELNTLIEHCHEIAEVLPLVGFYLQPAVGGRVLPYAFWRAFADIDNVLGIKIAPFNRYQTLAVVRAVCDAGREDEIALYTGNDDNIVVDLLTRYRVQTPSGPRTARIAGGLLGHWAVWTRKAVMLLEEIHALTEADAPIPPELLTRAAQITDCNAVFFDAANDFAGCIPGIHEVLRRQGLLAGTWCLNSYDVLSPGQSEEITRVTQAYPTLNDDAFVEENLALGWSRFSEVLTLRPMTHADIALGMRLSAIAGWNQVAADWEMLLAASAGGSWVALWEGTPAGTVTTVTYQQRFGWAGMVLVAPSFRRKGIGTALLNAAIAHASAVGTVRLDATPEGEQLYTKLGFHPEHRLIRMHRPSTPQETAQVSAPQNLPGNSPLVSPGFVTYDAPIFGADRGSILHALRRRAAQYARVINAQNRIAGYCLGR